MVTNTNDDIDTGSLRWAIMQANANFGLDTIDFSIGSGAQTVAPTSALPPITDPVIIDGTTQPGFAGSPLIELDGANAGGVTGLVISAGGSTVRGLVINRFGVDGISLDTNGGNVIQGNYIGTTVSGNAALGNTGDGIAIVNGASDNTIGGSAKGVRNVISGNGGNGVRIDSINAAGNLVAGNFIGTNAAGTAALGNGLQGVAIDGIVNTINLATGLDASGNLITTGGQVDTNWTVQEQGGGVGAAQIVTSSSPDYYGPWVPNGPNSDWVARNANVANNGPAPYTFYRTFDLTGYDLATVSIAGSWTIDDVGTLSLNGNQISTLGVGQWNTLNPFSVAAGSPFLNQGLNTLAITMTVADQSLDAVRLEGTLTGLPSTPPPKTVNLATGLDASGNLIATGGQSDANWTVQEQGGGTGAAQAVTSSSPDYYGPWVPDGPHSDWIARNANVANNGPAPYTFYRTFDLTSYDLATVSISGSWTIDDVGTLSLNGHQIAALGVGQWNALNPFSVATGSLLLRPGLNTLAITMTFTDQSLDAVRLEGTVSGLPLGTTIGGTIAGARNLISGNGGSGVDISGLGLKDLVEGNFIGTDVTGNNALGNAFRGVEIDNSTNNVVGGTTAGARNIISGNALSGGYMGSSITTRNVVEGNYIGLNAAGKGALGNGIQGVEIDGAPGNTIGGTETGGRNVISGNAGNGVWIHGAGATGNLIAGNFIGTNPAGTAPLGNMANGVEIDSSGNSVGGTTSAARNVISGNSGDGINITPGVSGTLVQGNYIGTNAAGTAALGNAGGVAGVEMNGASGNTIGGTTPGTRNVISGNARNGIIIRGAGATANIVEGNYIGTNAAGKAVLGNGGDGVFINDMSSNTIGGTTTGARNIIAGNAGNGIHITGAGGTNNVVEGNSIGTNAAGTAALGNSANGVLIEGGASNNTIGGTAKGAGNTIANNGAAGVNVALGTGNGIHQNAIFANTGTGIVLGSGANNNLPAPVLTSAGNSGTATTIQGTLTSAPNTTFVIEFFANVTQDPSGFGQGQRFIASITVMTDGTGAASFTLVLSPGVASGRFITATATDPSQDTSQFSNCEVVS
jgi:hypothetical protein